MEGSDVRFQSQERGELGDGISAEGRRLLLGSMLRVFSYRYRRGKLVRRDDLRQLLTLADDAYEPPPTPGGDE
jgi:hypothetical protein